MRSRDVVGKRIVAVRQHREKCNGGVATILDAIVLEDGVALLPLCLERENDGPCVELRRVVKLSPR